MLNQLLKLGIVITLGMWLKHRLRGLLILVAVLGVAWIIHNEYLAYIAQSGNTEYLELSYVVKWGVFIIGILLYYFLVERKLVRDPSANRNEFTNTVDIEPRDDGFDFLRRKKLLDSSRQTNCSSTTGKGNHPGEQFRTGRSGRAMIAADVPRCLLST